MLGIIITWIAIFSFCIFIVSVLFLIQGPPFVPSNDESTEQIMKMVEMYKPKRILDMGSGNGKLVILLAQKRYKVDGIELNPRLVLKSRRAIKKANLTKNAKIYLGNFWTKDVSDYDMIILYAIKHIMPRLEKKLISELKPKSIIVSNYFKFPNLLPKKKMSIVASYEI
ncbi:MAG TPA: methyltransferase domain-containing protein [Candidatus Saccharimonadales bacterium]|nr:methyltransferase domain-containing protein [Candidatus Saccharimonadales bacterium]